MKNKSDNFLPDLTTRENIDKFLKEPTVKIAEFLTGLLSSDLVSYKLSAGHIVQAAIKGKLLTQLGKELEEYREKGKIKEDYFATNRRQVSLLELLKFIDSNIPNEEVFKAMKAIFFSSVSTDADAKKEEIGYQLLLICKQLKSIDILILKTCYDIYLGKNTEGVNTGITSFNEWVNIIASKIGYDLPELISIADDRLVKLGLLSNRTYSDKSGVRPGKEFRLTRLGIKLCEFIALGDHL